MSALAMGRQGRRQTWGEGLRAATADLLAGWIGQEPGVVPGKPGHLVVLCHLDQVVAAGSHRWDAELALREREADEADVGLSPEDHRAWVSRLTECSVAVEGPPQAVRGVLAALGFVEGSAGLPLGPVAAGALRRRGLLLPEQEAPAPWGLSFDPELAGPIELDPTEAP